MTAPWRATRTPACRPIPRSRCSMPGRRRSSPVGLAAVMVMCAFEIRAGTKTVGDFVLINAMMIQLYQPLNFMGMVYREIKQAMTDIETHVLDSGARAGNQGRARRAAAEGHQRRPSASRMSASPMSRTRRILKGISFEVPAGKTVAVVGPSGAGKSTISRLLFRFYDLSGGRILIDGQDIANVTQKSLRAGDRHGAAGYRAVQRHHPLQHPLRPLGGDRRRGRGGGAAGADRSASSASRPRATRPKSASAG